MRGADADAGLDQVRVGGQAVQREQLRPTGTDERCHPCAVAVGGGGVRRELDDRPRQPVRPRHGVYPRIDQQQGCSRHVSLRSDGWHVTPMSRRAT
jgi:hypothetical protein